MRPVRVGVWGVGTWGEKHARVYQGLDEAILVGVFDHTAERAQAVADRYRCRAFATPESLLGECEAVSIAVPTVGHRHTLERAAASGCHALVEKPLAVTVEDADAMLEVARRAGITLQVGQVERFNPALAAARPHLRGPKFIEAHRLALFQPRSLDIDVVFDLMIHDIDVVLNSVGASPSVISAVGVAVLSENEDIANARLEFHDGCVANLTASRVSQERLRRIRFFQDDAYVSVDLLAKSCEILRVDRVRLSIAALASAPAVAAAMRELPGAFAKSRLEVEDIEPLVGELRSFVRSLRGEGAGAAGAEAGREALRVAAEVRAAMRQRVKQWDVRSSAVS